MITAEQQKATAHLADLMELEEGLMAWEIEFIESVHAQDYALTDRQIDVIHKIYARLC